MSHSYQSSQASIIIKPDMDSTYSDSQDADQNNLFLGVRSQSIPSQHSQISVIHDELEVSDINNTELDEYEFNIANELKKQIDHHKKSSYRPLPEFSLKSLQLDASIKQFLPDSISQSQDTPTIQSKESKELYDKLENVDLLVNGMNQYIMNHKSQRMKSDTFIINKLTEIQDNIEDAEVYIEEHIDKKLIQMQQTNKMMQMAHIKYEKDIDSLQRQLYIANNRISNLIQQQQSETDLISRMSSMSRIPSHYMDSQEKEGQDIKLQKQKEIKIKKQMFNDYYSKMNEFILKVTQKQYKLPLGVVEIISATQEKLIAENKKHHLVLDRQSSIIDNDEKMHEIENIYDYHSKYDEYKSEIANKMNELKLLNFQNLQLQLDTMDILQNNKKKHYKVFLHKIIHSMSRIFFDCDIILGAKVFDNKQTDYETAEYIPDSLVQILKTIPLTLSIIKLTDILLKTSNKNNVNVHDLNSYIQNINNFRILLNANGMDRFEFYQTFAVKMIHSGIVKKTNMERTIKLISNIFLSIIATNNYGGRLLSEICNNDVIQFIDCIILVIQNPPILNQVHISGSFKKKHKKNYKNIIMHQLNYNNATNATAGNSEILDDNISFASLIKNYYDLYSNKLQIKSLKKFEKYIRKKNIYPEYESESDSDVDSNSSDSEDYNDNHHTLRQMHDNEGDDEEINSLMKFFNEIYSKPAKVFVKCID